jgi:hypothetical protein
MKRFPFSKRTIEALPPHDPDSPSREDEYTGTYTLWQEKQVCYVLLDNMTR